MPKVSVLILAQNSARTIEQCVRSALEADEVVVIDGLSKDSTLEICRKYPVNIYEQAWLGFSRQRNFAISKASYDWVFFLDSDQYMSPELWAEIRKMLDGGPMYDGYSVPWRNHFLRRELRYGGQYSYQPRLFRKARAHYDERKRIHEGSAIQGAHGFLTRPVYHDSFPVLQDWLNRNIAYSTLEVEEMYESGKNRRGKEISLSLSSSASIWRFLLYEAVRDFLARMLKLKAYRDGIHGVIYALLAGFHHFVINVMYWDRKMRDMEGMLERDG